jgi:hypothetical protein
MSEDVAADENRIDASILDALTAEPFEVWSVAEVGREIGDVLGATDGVARLDAAGLIHRCGVFVWATRAARRVRRLADW